MTDTGKALDSLRQQIDDVDAELLALMNRRARLAQEVAAVKHRAGERHDYYRPEREATILRRAIERNPGPLTDETVARLLQELVSACRALEGRITVAFLGPRGTFTEAAALRHFGRDIELQPLATIESVFHAVEAHGADYGVVPVENSTEGVVDHTLDAFASSSLAICGEIELAVHHCLLSRAARTCAVRRVYAHSQALMHCRLWLEANLADAERVPVASNAEGARRAAQDAEAATIGAEDAAGAWELEVLARNIEDEPSVSTRFLVVGQRAVGPSGVDRSTLLVAADDHPGALHALIEPLARAGVSMSRIESRPMPGRPGGCLFFIDIDGHAQDAAVAPALAEIERNASLFRVLGSYPRAVKR